MAATDARFPSAATDTVALLRKTNFQQVAVKARAMKASVHETSKTMVHPVEDGTEITDHRVIDPVEIELSVLVAGTDYRDTYQQVRTLFQQAELLVVQTRTGSYPDMLIADMPHEEGPDMMDAVPIALRLREVKTVKASYGTLPPRAVARPADASTVKRGEVSAQDAAPQQKTQAQSVVAGKYDQWFGAKK